MSAYEAVSAVAAIKGELRENGVGEKERRELWEREEASARITLKGKAHFKRVGVE